MELIEIFCDGGCRNNHLEKNIGGWGVVIKGTQGDLECYGAITDTTNNRMELRACIEGLKRVRRTYVPIIVVTDSMYVVQGVNKWHISWVLNDWKTSQGKPVMNADLWKDLLELVGRYDNIEFEHCKGHADNEGNNRADYLVNVAMDKYAASIVSRLDVRR